MLTMDDSSTDTTITSGTRQLDNLTFSALYGLLQGGMWLLNDLEAALMPRGLSQGRLTILLQVSSGREVNPADIARITGKSRPTSTRMIDRLVADGLLMVSPDPADARRRILTLTRDGRHLLLDVVPDYNDRLRRMSRRLDDRDKADLLRILGKIDFLDSDKTIGPVS